MLSHSKVLYFRVVANVLIQRKWFQALYEILLGASQGPRFGGFIALYGIEETIALIDSALDGQFCTN